MSALRSALLSIAASCVALPAGLAAAQDDAGPPPVCTPEEFRAELVFPASGARDITLDAPIFARYTPGYFEPGGPGGLPTELLTVRRCSEACGSPFPCEDGGEHVAGRVQRIGDELVFLADGGWQADSVYAGTARGRFGDVAFRFCTGTAMDREPPQLGAIREITSTPIVENCEHAAGFRINVFLDKAEDDGPDGSIQYVVYQTRGPNIDGPVVRDRVENIPSETVTARLLLSEEEASGPVCVRVAAIDGVGNVTFNTTDEDGDCIDPVQGNFFYGLCSIGPASSSPVPGLAILALTALGLAFRRRR